MVENNFKITDDRQLGNFDSQTVFKRPEALRASGPTGTAIGLSENHAGCAAVDFAVNRIRNCIHRPWDASSHRLVIRSDLIANRFGALDHPYVKRL